MHASPMMRTVNTDWGERAPTLHFTLDQDRLQAFGLTLQRCRAATAIPAHRRAGHRGARGHSHRCRWWLARRATPGSIRRRLATSRCRAGGPAHSAVPGGPVDVRMEEPILRRRDRMPTITVRGDIAEGLQPPDVSTAMIEELQPIIEKAADGLPHRAGAAPSRSRAKRQGIAAALPDHARDHAAHHHHPGALDLRDGHGVRRPRRWG